MVGDNLDSDSEGGYDQGSLSFTIHNQGSPPFTAHNQGSPPQIPVVHNQEIHVDEQKIQHDHVVAQEIHVDEQEIQHDDIIPPEIHGNEQEIQHDIHENEQEIHHIIPPEIHGNEDIDLQETHVNDDRVGGSGESPGSIDDHPEMQHDIDRQEIPVDDNVSATGLPLSTAPECVTNIEKELKETKQKLEEFLKLFSDKAAGILQDCQLRNDTKMERKGNWLSSVKKAFSPESKEKKAQKSKKSKKKWFGKGKTTVPDSSPEETIELPHRFSPPEEVTWTEVETEQTKDDYSSEDDMEDEGIVAEPQAVEEVVQVTAVTQFTGIVDEEASAIKIQKAFRGYQARRGLRALRGLVRLKSLVQGPPAKRQTAHALRCMQTLARVQSQIQCRRIRMSEENQALQRQLLQKRAKELANLQIGDEWDASVQSKEQIEANLLSKYEAAMRRERAMAYSFSHQKTQKKSTRPVTLMFMDPNNPHWGWSWLERWMAENQGTSEKELHNDQSPAKNPTLNLYGGEITKSFVRHQLNSKNPSLTSNQKPTPPSNNQSPAIPPSVTKKKKPESPRESVFSPDSDGKSVFSVQTGKNRRHSISGPSAARDDESLGSSPGVPSYMAHTQSAKAKLRMQSPLGLENGTTPEKGSAGSTKKQLSYPASTAKPRRHSGPPKVEVSSLEGPSVGNGGAQLILSEQEA
ncbi:hypothetical protein RHMOL_Rhmol05G0248900 [Rhododendron molle]|uniref:Uncharacterized protein n=1 Tax=Rhododendron molle TaxID=49168 RepID=A0ACC0NSV2_RHOML|nr:hypothetical protein RHMOL_Rhmol05G0248900 [Rhododendron molle]